MTSHSTAPDAPDTDSALEPIDIAELEEVVGGGIGGTDRRLIE